MFVIAASKSQSEAAKLKLTLLFEFVPKITNGIIKTFIKKKHKMNEVKLANSLLAQ